jgi:hypothetical protein
MLTAVFGQFHGSRPSAVFSSDDAAPVFRGARQAKFRHHAEHRLNIF